jgi:predicted permease
MEHQVVIGDAQKNSILSGIWKDISYGARLLRLNPGFAIVAILSLALGIGANTAIFQLLDAVRLRTLPVNHPEELAVVKIENAPKGRTGSFSGSHPYLTYAIWEDLRAQQQAFSEIGAWGIQRSNLSQGGEARYAQTLYVSGGFFDVLRVRPELGRLISNADDHRGCGSAGAVISHSFWQREFGGKASALGAKVSLDGHPFEVIGITPSNFFGVEVGRVFDVAIPICAEEIIHTEDPYLKSRQAWWLAAIGRLKPDWTIQRASTQLASISKGLFESTLPNEYDAVDKKNYLEFRLDAVSAATGVSAVRREYQNPLWILMAISALVLLIACANLANLMVARASARQREMAVRLALGASRRRLIRQLLAESLLLAFVGALCGAILAQVLSRLLVSFLSTQQTRLFLDLQPNWHVLGFTAGLAILTCLVFGLTPAFEATRTSPGEVMKAHGRSVTTGGGRFGLRRSLVVSQVALSLVLLIGSLLFVRTLQNLLTLDAGFEQESLLVSSIDFSPLQMPVENRLVYKKEVLSRVRQLPNVVSAAAVAIPPLSGSGWNESINIPAFKLQRQVANFNQVSSEYFRTVGTPFLSGRDFNDRDTVSSPPVAIVTETFARKFFHGTNPVGNLFSKVEQEGKPDKIFQIIGLVKDSKYYSLREEFSPIVFVSESQDQRPDQEVLLMVRSQEPPARIISSIKQLTAEMNPGFGVKFRIFRTMVREGLIRERLMATLSGFFGFLAAILAMTGLYGVISYMVVRRRNEIGIRMALGANGKSILSMILREAATLLAIGIVIGIVLAIIGGVAAQTLLFGLRPTDPITIVIAVSALAGIAIIASLLPAQRAATLNPMQALRQE